MCIRDRYITVLECHAVLNDHLTDSSGLYLGEQIPTVIGIIQQNLCLRTNRGCRFVRFFRCLPAKRAAPRVGGAGEPGIRHFRCVCYITLHLLTDTVRAVEDRFVRLIADGGGEIKCFSCFEGFLQARL